MTSEKREILLDVKHLSVSFGKGRKAFQAIRDVSFYIYKGETFGLVGESGSGKTTIGRAIIRICPTSGGDILYRGQKINGALSRQEDRQVIRNIQMIFQDPMASLNERAKVSDIVAEGLMNLHPEMMAAQRRQVVEEALLSVGLLPEFSSRFPHEFSGGQRQRIGIARCLVMNPEFIIADEPISALDVSVRAQVLNLLMKFQRERGLTYLFIAHDLSVMRFIAHRVAVIYKGVIVELAETEKLFRHPLHPYTKALLSAAPIPNPLLEKKKTLLVYDPSCHNDSDEIPQWVEIEPEHFVLGSEAELETYRLQLRESKERGSERIQTTIGSKISQPHEAL